MRRLARDLPLKPLLLLMFSLTQRSLQKELLDADDIPFADIRQCMKELNTVNSLLGGHAITAKGIKEFIPKTKSSFHVCEIGCGGGDNLYAIQKKYRTSGVQIKYTGIDLKKECTEYAAAQYPELNARFIDSDYARADFGKDKPDVIFSSLFCHHFSDEELVGMLRWMKDNCTVGFFINDLQRSPIAYYLIKWITKIFSHSHLVINDAPVSVARSFVKKDWNKLFRKAAIDNYTISWQWAFRYLIVYTKAKTY